MRPTVVRKLNEVASNLDFNDAGFSFRRLREAAYRIADLYEANSESTFGYLLRSAVQEFANDVYNDLPIIYPNFVTEVSSKRRSEVYGGLYRPALPKQLDAGEKFQDTAFKGFEREIVNHKYGHIETFERELFDDDQTGQIRSRAANLGEGFRIFEEIYVLTRLFGSTTTQEGVEVPASTYNSGSPFTVAIGNKPATYARLSSTTLEAAHVALRSITDPLGRKFLVIPTVLIVSPIDEFLAWTLVNSPTQAWNTTNALSHMVNPLQGRYTVYASPFVTSKAWMVGDPKRGFVFQRRDPLEIVQENVQSGNSFIQEVYAFRARERFEADWIESRFCYLGDDGTES
jgi:hypothetical protein